MSKQKALSQYVSPKNAGLKLAEEIQKWENIEDLGTSIYQTNQQVYFMLQHLLRQKFNFSEEDLTSLHRELTKSLEVLGYFEEKGLRPLSFENIATVIDVTLNKYTEFKAKRAGIALPNAEEKMLIEKGNKENE